MGLTLAEKVLVNLRFGRTSSARSPGPMRGVAEPARPAVIQRALQIHVVLSATLASTLLGMAERSLELPLFVLLAGVSAFVLTDLLRWIRLNSTVTNLLAGGVLLVLLVRNIIELRGPAQMMGIANILVYMQIVCLFQEKDDRTCWLLALLGLLQVVVAAALGHNVVFAVLLIVYLALAPLTLGFLCVFREVTGSELQGRLRALRSAVSPEGGFRSFLRLTEPLEKQVVRLVRRHVRLVLLTTLIVTVALFFLMPRPRGHGFLGFSRMPVRSVGFTDRVRLGELGRIIENPQEVLRLRLEERSSGERYKTQGPLYLRGAILTQYSRGQWSHPGIWAPASLWPLSPGGSLAQEGLVRQDILIEPLDRPELFCIWPIVAEQANPGVLLDLRKMTLLRSGEYLQSRFRYRLLTPAFHEGQQWIVTPTFTAGEFDTQLRQLPPREGPGAVPTAFALAEEWLRELRLSPDDPYTLARAFERQLRDSGRFTYSLQAQPRDPNLDPVEDFLSRNRRGHCEYFASALVLMLRSVGVPARLVIGYKTEEFNPIGGFYQVRQLHAHTWVEVYLRMDQVPAELRLHGPFWDRAVGAWLRLDPTPPAESSLPSRIYWAMWQWLDWVDFIWRHYVVELDRTRQQEAIYGPISVLAARLWGRLSNVYESIVAAGGEIVARVRGWFTSPIGLALAVLVAAAMLLLVVRLCTLRGIAPWVWTATLFVKKRSPDQLSQYHVTAFYRRLERLLTHWGIARRPSQTPAEWAELAARKLPQQGFSPDVVEVPKEVVEAYYAVRYGRQTLSDEVDRKLHARMDLLEQSQRRTWWSVGREGLAPVWAVLTSMAKNGKRKGSDSR
ncbi:MAG: DUF3488 and transglutaminase-like domain-containing protein [Thermoguttaceae bacterium]|nr:DUF3488 and transglutaminase-like domain-containing protein [Thermoguttaceae bacterium]MDW8078670.1 DUF3488 and transglutaminase-like domain-containing protein [Thermoguttaceae bacterium]